jgi:hypothetical protein
MPQAGVIRDRQASHLFDSSRLDRQSGHGHVGVPRLFACARDQRAEQNGHSRLVQPRVPRRCGAFNGPAPNLAKTDMPFDGFKAQLRDPANDMPAYSAAVLSDQEIADMYAFVQSLPGARSAKDISILND